VAEPSKLNATLVLTGVAALAAALISASHTLSRDRIVENQRARLLMRLDEVLEGVSYDNEIETELHEVVNRDLLGSDEPIAVYIARSGSAVTAFVFSSVAPNGYNGAIDLLIGINRLGTITGVRVTRHRETPGLGDAIEIARSSWIEQFTGLSLGNPQLADWRLSRDGGVIDALTGATVTPRAVTDAVKNTLLYFRDQRQTLLSELGDEGDSAQ